MANLIFTHIMAAFAGSFLTTMIYNYIDYRTRNKTGTVELSGESWKSEELENYHYSNEWEDRNKE